MATIDELAEAQDEARLALLKGAKEAAERSNGTLAIRLAEAYAWITNPNQPHGASPDTK